MHLITGGTGFLGSALALELMAKENVSFLSRGDTSRVVNTLQRSSELYKTKLPLDHLNSIIEADILNPQSVYDTEPYLKGKITDVWHVAATLKYEDRNRDEIIATNVGGTANLVALAQLLNARFNYVSTAYTSGIKGGLIYEEEHTPDGFNNEYERSKVLAENLVRKSGLDYRIWRPSIIVGHSNTYGALSTSGFYGFMDGIARLKHGLERAKDRPKNIKVLGDPDKPLNIIPIDRVVKQMVALHRGGTDSRIIHLTNASPPAVGDVIDTMFEVYKAPNPEYVDSEEDFTFLDKLFNRAVVFQKPYVNASQDGYRVFVQDHATQYGQVIRHAFPNVTLWRYCDWYRQLTSKP